MAVCTTVKTGNHNDPTVWDTGTVPGTSDTVVINHQVTVVADWEFGTAPADSSAVLTLNANLVYGNDGTSFYKVDVRGSIVYNNAGIRALGGFRGGRLRLKDVPDGVTYQHRISTANNQAQAYLEVVGNGATVDTDPFILDFTRAAGGTTGVGTIENGGFSGGGQIRLTGVQVTLGSASIAVESQIWNSTSWQHKLVDCRIVNSGNIRVDGNLGASSTLDWLRTKWSGSLSSRSAELAASTTAGAKRSIVACTFDKTLRMTGPNHVTLRDNVFGTNTSTPFDMTPAGSNAAVSTLENSLIVHSNSAALFGGWNLLNVYVAGTYTGGNQHGFASPSATIDITYDGVHFDWDSGPTNGDLVLSETTGTGTRTRTWVRLTAGPRRSNPSVSCGRMFSFLHPTAGQSVVIEHNTIVADAAGLMAIGETTSGYADEIASVRSNLVAALNNQAHVIDEEAAGGATGVITTAGYNGRGVIGTGADLAIPYVPDTTKFGDGTPGANDVVGNPMLVDYTRNILRWGQEVAGLGTGLTVAQVVSHITSDPATQGAKISSLHSWVRAGFASQNSAFKGTAHDGTDIGALPVAVDSTFNGFSDSLGDLELDLVRVAENVSPFEERQDWTILRATGGQETSGSSGKYRGAIWREQNYRRRRVTRQQVWN